MRKALIFLLFAILSLSACGRKQESSDDISIVCVMFPEYDWTRNVVGDCEGIKITYLIDNGSDPHSFQPSVKDISTICEADIFIYGGGESEAWIENTLKISSANPDIKVLELMSVLEERVHEEETIEGMQGYGEEEEEPEYDEHIWLSLINAELSTQAICDLLSDAIPAQAKNFLTNSNNYCDQLSSLNDKYSEVVVSASKDTLLFADRFPFRYLIEDYNLNYYAAFSGCSSDVNANFNTIVYLSSKMDELDLDTALILESSNDKIANAILNNTKNGGKVLVLDSIQSVTSEEVKSGITYLDKMNTNLSVLIEALN